jgi:hypothetical protein
MNRIFYISMVLSILLFLYNIYGVDAGQGNESKKSIWFMSKEEAISYCERVYNAYDFLNEEGIYPFGEGCKKDCQEKESNLRSTVSSCSVQLPQFNKTLCRNDDKKGFDPYRLEAKLKIGKIGGVLCVGGVEVSVNPDFKRKGEIEVRLKRIPAYKKEILSIKDRYIIEPVGYKCEFSVIYDLTILDEFKKYKKNETQDLTKPMPIDSELVMMKEKMRKYFQVKYKKYLPEGAVELFFLNLIPEIMTVMTPLKVKIGEKEYKELALYDTFVDPLDVCFMNEKGEVYKNNCSYCFFSEGSHGGGAMGCMVNESPPRGMFSPSHCNEFGEIMVFYEFMETNPEFRFNKIFICPDDSSEEKE